MGIEFSKQKSVRLIVLILMIVMFVMFAGRLTANSNFYDRMLSRRIEENYAGVVNDKFVDEEEHNTPKIKLTDTTISIENIFWNQICIGDSIVKIKGSPIISIYRNHYKVNKLDYIKHFNELKSKSVKKAQ